MSISSLASQLYSIKSRKNVPLTSAFASMVREDLAARLSVYNLVRIITRSEFLATVAQAKYGKRTPLEREEETREKKKAVADAKFRQFTASSIANLNNRVNGLVAITQRNTALIANLYGELGAYRNKKMPTLSSLNNIKDPSAVRLPIRSRTVKAQIDMLQQQLAGLAANDKPFVKKIKTQKEKQKEKKEQSSMLGFAIKALTSGPGLSALATKLLPLLAIGVVNAGVHAAKRETQRILGIPEEQIEGSNPLNQKTDRLTAGLGLATGGLLARSIYKRFIAPAVKVSTTIPTPPAPTAPPAAATSPAAKPTTAATTATKAGRYWDGKMWRTVGGPKPTPAPTTPTPTTPTAPAPTPAATTKPQMPDNVKWNAKAQRWQNTVTGKFVKAPKAPLGSMRGPGTTAGAVTRQNLPSSQLGNLFNRLPPGLAKVLGGAGKILGTGPQTVALLMQGAGEMASGRAGQTELARQQAKVAKFGIKFLRGEDGAPIYEINGKQYTSENLPPEYQVILNAYVGDERSASARQAKMQIAANPALYNSLIVQRPPAEADVTTNVAAAVVAAAKISEPPSSAQPQKPGTYKVSQEDADKSSYNALMQSTSNLGLGGAGNVLAFNPGLPIDFAAYAKKIAELESAAAGGYKAVNSIGYLGKYQFGALALQDLGLVKRGTKQNQLDDPKNWNLQGGKEAFLNNPKLQETSFAQFTRLNYMSLKRFKLVQAETPPDQVAGFLAVSHLLGPGGAIDLSKGKDGKDAYGTTASKYFAAGKQTQVVYLAELAKSPPKSQAMLAVAPPAPLIAATTNAVVATPPTVSTSEAAPNVPTVEAQINATAALTAVSMVQKQVNVVAEQVIKERKFNQVDDATVVNLDMRNYGLA